MLLLKRPVTGHRVRSLLFGLFGYFLHGIREFLPLTGTDPVEMDPITLQAEGIENRLQDCDPSSGLEIATHIVAFAGVSPPHENGICPQQERPQNINGVNRSRAHDTDGPEIRGILQPRCPREVGGRGRAPVTEKTDDFGFKIIHESLL